VVLGIAGAFLAAPLLAVLVGAAGIARHGPSRAPGADADA
jgi:hypothetical protein